MQQRIIRKSKKNKEEENRDKKEQENRARKTREEEREISKRQGGNGAIMTVMRAVNYEIL